MILDENKTMHCEDFSKILNQDEKDEKYFFESILNPFSRISYWNSAHFSSIENEKYLDLNDSSESSDGDEEPGDDVNKEIEPDSDESKVEEEKTGRLNL